MVLDLNGKIKGFDIDTISALTKLSEEEINYNHKQKTLCYESREFLLFYILKLPIYVRSF